MKIKLIIFTFFVILLLSACFVYANYKTKDKEKNTGIVLIYDNLSSKEIKEKIDKIKEYIIESNTTAELICDCAVSCNIMECVT